MADYNGLLKLIKQAAAEAVDAGSPATICTGKVLSINPLSVQIDQKITLSSMQLLVPESLKGYTTTMTIDGVNKSVVVPGRLTAGSTVSLVRQQGGQKYLIIDKVV